MKAGNNWMNKEPKTKRNCSEMEGCRYNHISDAFSIFKKSGIFSFSCIVFLLRKPAGISDST
jgi:hypothetical protein